MDIVEQHIFYISSEQAFRKVITTIKGAIMENAFSEKSKEYDKTVSQLEKMLKELTETGKINTGDKE